MTNQLAKKDFFNAPAVKEKFQEVLKGSENQFIASLLSVVNNNNLLSRASNQSIMTAAMKAAVLNLPIEPSLGHAYIVPYKNEAQFQIGYKGLIQLAIRSGQIKGINSGVIYKSQFKAYDPLFETLEVDFTKIPDEVVGYFATLELVNGFKKLTYWTKEQAEAHGKRFSMSFNKGPWKTDFDAMAQKTLLKQIISKFAPLSTELQEAIIADNATEQIGRSTIDVTPPESTASLSELIGQSNSEIIDRKEAEVISDPEPLTDHSYPVEEIPDFDQETGEILDGEQGKLFGSLAEVTEQ